MLFGTLINVTVLHSFTRSLYSNSEIGSQIVSCSFPPIYYSSLFIKHPTRLQDWIRRDEWSQAAVSGIRQHNRRKKLLGLPRCTVNFTVATDLGIDSRRWKLCD